MEAEDSERLQHDGYGSGDTFWTEKYVCGHDGELYFILDLEESAKNLRTMGR